MLKWIFIVLLLGIVLSAFLQHKIQQISATDNNGQPSAVSVRPPGVVAVKEHRPAPAYTEQTGRLSLPEERLSNRVAPVHESQLKDDVLPQ